MSEWTILWRRLDVPGHDACTLRALAGGWHLSGTALFALENRPCRLAYEVECDAAWYTRAATVNGAIGNRTIDLAIVALPQTRWSLNGHEQARGAGCVDLDLNFTPSTNLIALRRLSMKVGDAADAPAAWLRFPELTIERLDQHYRRIATDQYEYRAPAVEYAATLKVSPVGFVTDYPGLWETVCAGA